MYNGKILLVFKKQPKDEIDDFFLVDLDPLEKKVEQIREQWKVELPEQAEETRQTQEA